jgi:hypothetical protein
MHRKGLVTGPGVEVASFSVDKLLKTGPTHSPADNSISNPPILICYMMTLRGKNKGQTQSEQL